VDDPNDFVEVPFAEREPSVAAPAGDLEVALERVAHRKINDLRAGHHHLTRRSERELEHIVDDFSLVLREARRVARAQE
jgi:hypothetical protein